MQHINKIIFLNYYRISSFFELIIIFFNILIVFLLLSGCSTLFLNSNKTSLITHNFEKNKKIKYIDLKRYNKKRDNNNTDYIMRYNYTICKGDQIGFLLNQSGVSIYDILKLIKTDPSLNVLKISQNISWKVNQSGELLELTWNTTPLQKKIYQKIYNKFLIFNTSLKNLLIKKTIFIKKDSNFFKSAYESGLNKLEISDVIKAIKWQIDFRKLYIDSYFDLIFSRNPSSNKKNKKILLGVKLNNSGKKYYAIRAFNGNFYDKNGCSQKKIFINYSFLKKYRISSKFNLHRLNPVTHRISRHLGVDLAMPQGTPVLAASNGEVIKAHFNNTAGFHVALKNKNEYVTRYMHLKEILVKLGDQVKIGQKIALSGNTGRTTGPHLHYEIWINDCAVDPLNSKFMISNELTKQEKIIYLKEAKKILKLLK